MISQVKNTPLAHPSNRKMYRPLGECKRTKWRVYRDQSQRDPLNFDIALHPSLYGRGIMHNQNDKRYSPVNIKS